MKRNILIFQENTQASAIEKYIKESVDAGYNLTIVKIVPKFYNGEVYAYTNDTNWLTTILEKYEQINSWYKINYNNLHHILFNIELSQNNINEFLNIVNNYQLPLFIDYFYTYGDTINYSEISTLKNNVKRIDFNNLFSNTLEISCELKSIIDLFDNYDIYQDNILQPLNEHIIRSYINDKNKLDNNELNFKELLENYHSATPIFILENDNLSLSLFGFKRFHKMNIITNHILSNEEFLQKTIIYLSKRMSKNYICSECEQRNNCFTQDLWLHSNFVESQEECLIYPLLQKEL